MFPSGLTKIYMCLRISPIILQDLLLEGFAFKRLLVI